MARAVALLSGGLDSFLATKLILEQGIVVEGVYFSSVFYSSKNKPVSISRLITHQLNIPLASFDISLELLKVVKNPKHGYGKNLNPCIDCRILMLKKAYQYMKKLRADFLITGEVLGERPFSQRRQALTLIGKEAGLEGLILRPLSAKLLRPTLAEEKGLINRGKLLDIKGKSRKPQFRLAEELGIKKYLTPAGGCLLTEEGFSQRMKDLFRYNPEFLLEDVKLLKIGRHFRISPKAKLIVARNENECKALISLAKRDDFVFYPQEGRGPVGLGRGNFEKDDIFLASGIVARYTDKRSISLKIVFKEFSSRESNLLTIPPLAPPYLESLRI